MRSTFLITNLLLITLVTAACSVQPPALEPVTVQLRWYHQAQFAGFYVADQQGYYADEGLQVSFIEGGPEIDLQAGVLDGSVQFSITGPELLIQAHTQATPIQAIAVIYGRNPMVIMTMPDSPILHPTDLEGHTIHVPNSNGRIQLITLMNRLGLETERYRIVQLSDPSNIVLIEGQVDAAVGYLNNQPIEARKIGYDLNLLYLEEFGVSFYADTLIANQELLADDPDLVEGFLRATLKGWEAALSDPDAAVTALQVYAPDSDREVQTEQLIASIPLIDTGTDPIGWMHAESWAYMEQVLYEQGVIDEHVDVSQLYTMQFLEAVYGTETDE
jgi:NitT/TauT family transport system substrate-binding protein